MISEQDVVEQLQGVSPTRLRVWIKRGWVSPTKTGTVYYFREIDVARLDLIRQLQMDMAINNEAVPVVLSLIDQIHGLRYELKTLARAVEAQHEDVQSAILDVCTSMRPEKDDS
ncbi:chaperone modulator CbpM [Sneathiella sp. HT1-7]|jgi:chaperone modulatory protein CbpM|uniref:chaperone modulator CbpM n=1 Tax=Sneathiella sp. HT1-7 TaxID=2887192 RepID=UPI001D140325|nr:chaperone modulator CbpM [Sneathiella sp. HT1-7]MCC3306432.1 chaperone modulator CbpM [Sneathiella sp. HT1-7]